jgi:hypothetical protein
MTAQAQERQSERLYGLADAIVVTSRAVWL